ncbi:Hypothetical predicted protein [Octopus vulgaris]|uniref:Uncharacterized protein n=1 Tax=Octopus vulgaris TaxID=6645 RepID=A0AA36F8A6_OCTVU|nr:Hypothetical predicted protein [Octopus vulgaris]
MPKSKVKRKILATKLTEDLEEMRKKIKAKKQMTISIKDIYYPRIKEYKDNIEMMINNIDRKCIYLESIGLDKFRFLQDVKSRLDILEGDINNHEFIVFPKLNWFLERLFEIYVSDNHSTYKNIAMPTPYSKFRHPSSVVSTTPEFHASGEDSQNLITNIVAIYNGIVTYSPHLMTLRCTTTNHDEHVLHCPSQVTDIAKICKDTVMVTIPFRKKILFFSPSSCTMKTFPYGFKKISHVKDYEFVGVKLFSKIIYLVDWYNDTIESKFSLKDEPTNIAIAEYRLLVTFTNFNHISCYNLNGHQLFQLYGHSLDSSPAITVYHNYFYVLQGNIIHRISPTGGVSQREIGIKARHLTLGKNIIVLSDYLGFVHIIRTNEDFWPRTSYLQKFQTPVLNNQIYIDDPGYVQWILPISSNSTLFIYSRPKAVLFTDNGKEILEKACKFHFQPDVFCKFNSNTFLILFREQKKIQFISYSVHYPILKQGHIIDVHFDYIRMCHMILDKVLAVTTSESKEVHILSIKNDNVIIENKISLEHVDVTIAATPLNFIVGDLKENKLLFYSSFGERLFEKQLDFDFHHIYSDNLHFYIVHNKGYFLKCYNIYGEVEWRLQFPCAVHSQIGVFQGTFSVLDIKLNRVLFYKYKEWSSCHLDLVNPYIQNIDLRDSYKNKKILIADVCHIPNGQLVVSDMNTSCLLYISKDGRVMSTLFLPSLATDICRWDSSQIGITLPLEKELRVIGNLSKRVRSISLSKPYVCVRKFSNGRILCFCDKPCNLDIVSIQKHNQGEIISTISVPFVIKPLAIDDETFNVLIVTKKKVFECKTSSKADSTLLPTNFKPQCFLHGGCIDKTCVYLIDESRLFALSNHNLEMKDPLTRNQLNMFIDHVDVFSRNICVTEMLSSKLYLQDLSVSDKSRECLVPQCLGDEKTVNVLCSVITENNLIAICDQNNKNIKVLTFDGKLLDSIKLDVLPIRMCRWRPNTLAMTVTANQLLSLAVEFPLSFTTYEVERKYKCIASFSDNQLVCSIRQRIQTNKGPTRITMGTNFSDDKTKVPALHIIELLPTIRVIKEIDLERNEVNNGLYDIAVNADDVIIVYAAGFRLIKKFIIFMNRNGERLHTFCPLVSMSSGCLTIDDAYVYASLQNSHDENTRIVCLTHTGKYKKIFFNSEHCTRPFNFTSISCKGPKFVGFDKKYLYAEGMLKLNRESFHVCQLVTDRYSVQIKDIDISVDGKTVVIEKGNTGNVKLYQRNGKLLYHTDLETLVGGVCFSDKNYIMVTVPDRQEIFQLSQEDLRRCKVWQTSVSYGLIRKKIRNTYYCVLTNLAEYHIIQIDGDQLKVLKCTSIKLGSVLHFSSSSDIITQITNKKVVVDQSRSRSSEIVERGLKVRRGNYIANCTLKNDQITIRRLPHRTKMFPISTTVFGDPNRGCDFGIYKNIHLIKLQEDIVVLLYQLTLIVATTEGHILQQRAFERMPLDICYWTERCFVAVFSDVKGLMFFNSDLTLLKTINTEKTYTMIHKKNTGRLVCAYEGDPNRIYRPHLPSSYVDVLHIDGATYEYSCQMDFGMDTVTAIGVTSSEDIVILKKSKSSESLCWYRDGLVRLLDIPLRWFPRRIAIHGEKVYITERESDILQVTLDTSMETYISLADIEVYLIYDIHVTEGSLILLGGLDSYSCAVFCYET